MKIETSVFSRMRSWLRLLNGIGDDLPAKSA